MSAQTQTEEISKTIAFLKFETIRDSLKYAKCKSAGTKPVLVKNYEAAVLDVGIEKFVGRLPDDLVAATAKLINVAPGANQNIKEGLTEGIQSVGLNSVLGKSDEDLLKKFSSALGLEEESCSDYAKKIEDEVMLIGMEGFLQNLNPDLLRKHCMELNLPKNGQKSELVEKLMVHIFELEPLTEKKEAPPTLEKTVDKEKEEAKPKENKKRKAEPKEKKMKKAEKKVAKKEEVSNGQRPKRSAATKKKDEETEERPAKKQKKEPPQQKETAKKEKAPKKEAARNPRTPYIAPPLSTIIKGQYSGADLHNKFNLTDLQKYARQEGLKSSGQKKSLIKRITTYLETGNKDEGKKENKKGRGKLKKGTKEKAKGGSKKKAPKEDKEKSSEAADPKATEQTKE